MREINADTPANEVFENLFNLDLQPEENDLIQTWRQARECVKQGR